MKLAYDVLTIITLTSLFCISHSVLASNKVKRAFQRKFGNRIAYYRIGYNIISFISLLVIYPMLPQIEIKIYSLPHPSNFIIIFFQLLSILGLILSAKYFSAGEFTGWSQLKRFRNGNYNANDLDEKSELIIKGPYKFSRHPVYFFAIMLLILRVEMGLTYFIIVVIFVAYFYIGSIFEEKRLVEKFGETYANYQKSVPRIFPINIIKS